MIFWYLNVVFVVVSFIFARIYTPMELFDGIYFKWWRKKIKLNKFVLEGAFMTLETRPIWIQDQGKYTMKITCALDIMGKLYIFSIKFFIYFFSFFILLKFKSNTAIYYERKNLRREPIDVIWSIFERKLFGEG